MGGTPRRAKTPKSGGTPRGTPRASSAPPKERPDLGSAVKKVTAGAAVSKALMGGAAPQSRGDPNNIKVGVRCRPLSKTELSMNEETIVQFSGNSICLTNPAPAAGEQAEHIYAYDHLYQLDSESSMVFDEIAKPLVEGLLEGFNGTIFAYGQTGSGKTFSMMGIPERPGVIPLVARDIFERRAALLESLGEGGIVKVQASYIQIYREVLQDLLGKDINAELKIRRDPKIGTYVQGLSETSLEDADGLTKVIDDGNKRRAVAATLMNAESSRSHAVVIIRIDQEHPAKLGQGKKKIASKINLVDLAGSERASKTGATGETLKEAIAINQSLSALGNVINALSDPKAKGHIPYRSSKLTHLLEESLGGNSNTVMLAAISPAGRNFPETLQTLQYASRAKMIVTNAKSNAFQEQVKGSAFGAQQAEEMQAQMAAQMQEQLAAQQAAQQAQMEAQLAALMAAAGGGSRGGGGGASSEDLEMAQAELSEVKAQLAAAKAVAELHESSLDEARRRADEAERQRREAAEAHELARAAAREQQIEEAKRVEATAAARQAERQAEHAHELQGVRDELARRTHELDALAADKEQLAADKLEGQVMKAQAGEELRERTAELQAAQVKLAGSAERVSSLEVQLEQQRAQMRTIEAQRDQAWAREKLLEEQRAAADANAKLCAEQRDVAQQQLQAALTEQVDMQKRANEQASAAETAEVAGSLANVQKALARLEARHEAQAVQAAEAASKRTSGQEEELARLDQLLQAQAQAHAHAIEQLEKRAASEAERLGTVQRLAVEQAEAQLGDVNARLREAMEDRVRLQSENATRKAAADALGERIALLQDQLSSAQLDVEQQKMAMVAERAEADESSRAKQEELEAARLQVLQHQHEAEALRQQLRERDESLARRAERLRQLQALYERALQDKQRVEEAAWSERQSLHEERRALELRIREEAGRARQAYDAAQRSRNNPGLLERIFHPLGGTAPGGADTAAAAKEQLTREAWAEQPAALPLNDSARVPVPNGGRSTLS